MDGKKFIGLDIGGTHISAVVLSDESKIIAKKTVDTPRSKNRFIGTIKSIVLKLNPKSPAIGIAVAGIINKNVLKRAPNISFLKNFDFQIIFDNKKVILNNDARAFLKGEIQFIGVSKKTKILGLTIGTGIGRALAVGKNVKKIKSFEYPEKWERQYQKFRETKSSKELAKYLAEKISKIINNYKPGIIILGGGVIIGRKDEFLNPFKKELKNIGVKSKIKIAKMGNIAGAYGSAINAKSYLNK